MGDYEYALQSNNSSSSRGGINDSAIHHVSGFSLPKHHRNQPRVALEKLSNNSFLFLPVTAQQTMQDDLLMDKSKAQPQQQEPANLESPSTPTSSSEPPKSEDIPSSIVNQPATAQNNKEKAHMESPILPGLTFHQPQEPGGTSLSPSFGSTWSTGTTNTVDDSFFQGIPPVNGTMLFQNFPHHVNPVFSGTFSPQIGLAQQQAQQQQQRRSPVSPSQAPFPQRNAYNHPTLMNTKVPSSSTSSSAWNNHQNAAWNSTSNPWSGLQANRDPRRAVGVGVGVGVPSPLNPISPLKKPYSSNNTMGKIETTLPKKKEFAEYMAGRSSLFPFEDGLLDDSHGDQSLTSGLNSPTRCQNGERVERYSRKVFVGGLPPDIDEDEITTSFRRYGHLVVDWPHKAESKSYFPPKGYAFLLFQEESSVQALIDACIEEDGKLYLCVSSPTIKDKPVQIRPWNLSDSDFVMDGSQPLDPRKTIFVGGVPRPLRAVELAMIMDRLYGGVCYAGIDTDPELKYPKGAGRVAFSNQQSYIAAISARFVQLQHNDIDKRVEVKPYVLDDQMCDECQGARCGGKFAPFFCANVTCLQYYCEYCWASIHSRAGREFHKPLVKEGGDRPRHVSFRWS
ncbi:CPEB4 protein, partial [Polypterus senegalus]